MHENAHLLDRFYASLQAHDHRATADCYDPDASFEDIAFKLRKRRDAAMDKLHAFIERHPQ